MKSKKRGYMGKKRSKKESKKKSSSHSKSKRIRKPKDHRIRTNRPRGGRPEQGRGGEGRGGGRPQNDSGNRQRQKETTQKPQQLGHTQPQPDSTEETGQGEFKPDEVAQPTIKYSSTPPSFVPPPTMTKTSSSSEQEVLQNVHESGGSQEFSQNLPKVIVHRYSQNLL